MKILPCGIAVLENDTHLSRFVAEHGKLDCDPTYTKSVFPLLDRGSTAIDVGAALGDTTIGMARAVGMTGSVIAIEPNPRMYECLSYNMARFPWVTCIHAAADEENLSRYRMVEDDNAGKGYVVLDPTGTIHSVSLDTLPLARCQMIKLDCEGYELKVLLGAKALIAKCRPLIVMELNRESLERTGTSIVEVRSWLHEHGYSINPLVPENFSPEQYDVLCVPQ